MAVLTVTIDVPDSVLRDEPLSAIENRLRLLWALDEIRAGRMTRVGAAAWLSLSLDTFLAQADAHGLPTLDYDPDDLRDELASLS